MTASATNALLGFADRPGVIWHDGNFVRWSAAQLHVLSHALHYAQAVFEGERAYSGTVFRLREHTRRLIRSAEMLGFTLPYSEDELCHATAELIDRQKIADGYIRPIAWLGSETMGISPKGARVHVAIAAWDWKHVFSAEAREKGITLCTSQWRRPPSACSPVQAKAAGLYTTCVLSRSEANSAGYDDALMLDYDGAIAEVTGANIFIVKDGVIATPETHSVLNGITRQTVIQLLREMGSPVVERRIDPRELVSADEVFLTGTAYEIQPVCAIDGKVFGSGPIAARVAEQYQALVHRK